MFDLDHPFFIPLWRRLAIVVVCLAWALFEFATGSPGWSILFGGLGVFAAYRFFVTFNPRPPGSPPS